jgi:two-component system, chemotaxis family, protein-glutamate methylesterase/glutaminase
VSAPGFAVSHTVDAVAVGASAGGVDALLKLLDALPRGFRLPLVIVLHQPEAHASVLPDVFAKRTGLPSREAADKAPVEPGTLYFAPPGYHLSVEQDRSFSLSLEPPVLFSRPSIDVLMDSAADAYGSRLAGILLTGASEDGARGLTRIHEAGGLSIVQDPAEAQMSTMPLSALARHKPGFVLPLADIRKLLLQLDARQ